MGEEQGNDLDLDLSLRGQLTSTRVPDLVSLGIPDTSDMPGLGLTGFPGILFIVAILACSRGMAGTLDVTSSRFSRKDLHDVRESQLSRLRELEIIPG